MSRQHFIVRPGADRRGPIAGSLGSQGHAACNWLTVMLLCALSVRALGLMVQDEPGMLGVVPLATGRPLHREAVLDPSPDGEIGGTVRLLMELVLSTTAPAGRCDQNG